MSVCRLRMSIAMILLAFAPLCARADTGDMVAMILADLTGAGYEAITVERTLLNRERIVATRGDVWREIVVDPRTGEILRDLRRSLPGTVQNGDSRDIIAGRPDPGTDSTSGSDGTAPTNEEPEDRSEEADGSDEAGEYGGEAK